MSRRRRRDSQTPPADERFRTAILRLYYGEGWPVGTIAKYYKLSETTCWSVINAADDRFFVRQMGEDVQGA